MISVVVPVGGADPERERAWEHVRRRYEGHEVVVAEMGDSKAAAVNEGVRRATGDVLVIADADSFVARDVAEVEPLARGAGWCVPFAAICRLDAAGTDAVLAGAEPDRRWLVRSPYAAKPGGGIVAVTRDSFEAVGGFDERFCVDAETEILTAEGWRTYDALRVGDLVLTLNHVTGLSEWQPAEAVNVFPVIGESMLSIEHKNHSSLTTLDHRWPTVRRTEAGGRPRRPRRVWTTSAELCTEDRVPIAADCADLPNEPKFTDSFVELVAWFYTEGTVPRLRNGAPGRGVVITQSHVVNPTNCERIDACLTRALGPPSPQFPRRGRDPRPDVPRWRDGGHSSKPRDRRYVLNAEAGALLQHVAPGRVPSYEFLRSLTRAQLELFIMVSLLADGHGSDFSQKRVDAAEAFQFACIIAGHATSVRVRYPGDAWWAKYGYAMTNVRRRTARGCSLSKGKRAIEPYSGVVWCPTTANGTWLARRAGTVWFTGNSGWGGEDQAFGWVLEALVGEPATMAGPLWHLWHEPAGKMSAENRALALRYRTARTRPAAMRVLLAEFARPAVISSGGDGRPGAAPLGSVP